MPPSLKQRLLHAIEGRKADSPGGFMAGSKGAILVVGDQPESLKLLTGILAGEGYRVRPAGGDELALASVAVEPPELILLDTHLGGMDGLEVCRRIKAYEASRHIPLLFVSAATSVEERVEGLALGAVDFVSKPFRREELLARIRNHLELGRLRAQLEIQVAQRTAELRAATGRLHFEIAERQCTEMALRESAERFSAIFSQAAVGITQCSANGEWRVVNDRFCEIVGYTRAELLEMTVLDITHPDDRERCVAALNGILAREIPSYSAEKRYVRKDGAPIWVRLFVTAVWDADRQMQYFIGVIEDIHEKVQTERALRDSERHLALAQNAAHLGLWDWDLRTNAHRVFGEYLWLYGLPADQPPTFEDWLNLVHPDDRERVQSTLRESLEITHAWDTEYRVVRPDGSVRWLLGKGAVFLDDSGRPIRITGVNLDVTERKLAEATERESEAFPEYGRRGAGDDLG